MKLVRIPENMYDDYRLDVIFRAYKWDPQFSDVNTLSRHALVISEEENAELERLTEQLDRETAMAEQALGANLGLAKPLALPRKARKELPRVQSYQEHRHIRLMRFDFHPIAGGGWAVSEVNSDVPGGFAEASEMPKITAALFEGRGFWCKDFGETITRTVLEKVKSGGCAMLVHCTSYSDDRQVMQFLGDRLEGAGFRVLYGAADHLRFENNKAISILDGNSCEVDAIIRFTPLEWLIRMKPKRWEGFFDTITPSCNHPIAIFAQTKRFPFVWDALEKIGVPLPTWRELLPETLEVRHAKNKSGFLFKPALGRVGEGVAIKEACRGNEYRKIIKDVKRHPKRYVAQKKFHSLPLACDDGGSYHVCIGSYSVEGKAAGYYARISTSPRIDSCAEDIPVLIEGAGASAPLPVPLPSPRSIESKVSARIELFKAWAPSAKWTQWVLPVPFAAIDGDEACCTFARFETPPISYVDSLDRSAAIFVDLPSYDSVEEGLSLARLGWRPIPLHNFTDTQHGAMALVDCRDLKCALTWGAGELAKLSLPGNAPPAFLLDSNRTNRFCKNASVFDNSWDLFEQDIPSAEYFLGNGISKIIIRGRKVQKDLSAIFYKFRKKGLEILFTDGYEQAKEAKLRKKSTWGIF